MIKITGQLPIFCQAWKNLSPLSCLEIICIAIANGASVIAFGNKRIEVMDGSRTIRFEGTVEEMLPMCRAAEYVRMTLLDTESAEVVLDKMQQRHKGKGEGKKYFQHTLAVVALMEGAGTSVRNAKETRLVEHGNLTLFQAMAMVRLTAEGMTIPEAVPLVQRYDELLNTEDIVVTAGKVAENYGLKHTDMLISMFDLADKQLVPQEWDLILPHLVALSKTQYRPPEDINFILSKAGVPKDKVLVARGMMSVKGWSLANFLEVVNEMKTP